MITRNLVIAAPNWDPFCGLVVNCMKYDLAKVHIILRIEWPVNTITKRMRCWQMDSKGSSHCGIYISAIMAPMDKPTCGGVCKFIIHRWAKGFIKQGNGSSGTHAPTGCTAAVGQQGQRAQEKIISLISWIQLPQNFSEACAKMWNTLWLKDMVIGAMEQWGHACQMSAVRLRGFRGSKHKNNYISFVFDSLPTKFGRDMCRFMKNILVKLLDEWRARSHGTCMPNRQQRCCPQGTGTWFVRKLRRNSITRRLWHMFYNE
jgi:hypothetical protein